MISVPKATQIIKENLILRMSVISEPIVADRDYPPFHRIMMDGIAVSYATYESGGREFAVAGIQSAGEAAKKLSDKNHCLEVMTGAPLPEGTDLVIPYEQIEISGNVARVTKEVLRRHMENVHLMGSDCRKGEVVLKAGAQLNGPHQGIAASMGVRPKLSQTARIQIISTGNELVEVNETPLSHQIRRSNAHALKKSLEVNGFNNITLDHLRDDPQVVTEHYLRSAPEYDVMIYSGGVSKGKFDYLPNVWSDLGVTKHFHQVAQRPGKPLWFGTDEKNKTTVIGLPGNPVSSLVCLHRYIIPGKKMYARLSEEIIFKKDLTFFVPVKIEYKNDGSLWSKPLQIQNSGEFTALAESDGFIELPAEQEVFPSGEAFAFWPWRSV